MTNNSKTAQTEKSISGYIYIVVFDNGTVKVGKSKFSPETRIISHVNAGIAFGVNLNSSFVMKIYENNLILCENELIDAASLLSKCHQGREWFKFENVNDALFFAERYNLHMEKINVIKKEKVKNKNKISNINQPFTVSPILDNAIIIAGSQKKLAEQMSVTPGAVSQWRRHLPYKVALALVQRYGKKKPLDPVAAWEKKHFNQVKEAK